MTKETNPIGYQFTPVPTNLIFMLDPSCFKLMSLLIQEESYQKAKNNVKNNCFPEAIKRLSLRIPMCEKDTKLTIQSLKETSLIEVIEQGMYHRPNLFKINWDRIKEIDQYSVTDLTNNVIPMICKKKRATSKDRIELVESILKENDGQAGGKVDGQSDTPLLDNTDNTNNTNNTYNINNSINNNIINNEGIGEESFHSLNASIEQNEQVITTLNDEQLMSASAPMAAAHGVVSTESTKEQDLVMHFIKASKEKPEGDFLLSIHAYTMKELNQLDQALAKEDIPMDSKLRKTAIYWIAKTKLRGSTRI